MSYGSFLASGQTITLDGSSPGKIFQGLGGVSAGGTSRLLIDYPEPYRGQILDYLFKPNYGAGIQHLKIELGGDVDSTSGAEPSHMHSSTDQNYSRGYEWWLMQQAKLRNPNITFEALEWGVPGWIGNGNFFSQDNINYIINFIQGAKSTYGISIDYVGIWNESDFNVNWIISLKAALQQAGLTTKVIAADQQAANTNIIEQMLTYPSLMTAVDIIGVHYPANPQAYTQALNGQPTWDTEDGAWRGDWVGATFLAKAFNNNYIGGKITLAEVWSPVTSYYDVFPIPGSGMMYANTPWSGNYDVQPAIWAMAHTTQFAQPGWQYLDNSCGTTSVGSYVTLKQGSDYSVIFETLDSGINQTFTFNITGGLSTGKVHVWMSNSISQFVQQSDITPVNGSFTMTFAPGSIYSLTTTTGQSKGNATPPSPAAFPFPYYDSFEGYTPSQEAKYFSAISGSFEIAPCGGGRSGSCLRQAVSGAPIAWHEAGPAEPAAFLGSTGWTNYEVTTDVYFEQAADVKLVGRMTQQDINSGNVFAYQFYVNSTGGWVLCHDDSDYLSSGAVSFTPNTWHTLSLVMNGTQIQGVIDGVVVTTVTDYSYAAGMAGLGVREWANVQFDNFTINPIPGAPVTVPQSSMTATATSQATGYEASKAVDGNHNTFWQGAYSCVGGCMPTAPLPQSITINLGGTYNVYNLRYLPRQDGNGNGNITTYNVYLSTDGVSFKNVATGNWGADFSEKNAGFTQASAAYIRLEATAALGGYVAACEINVDYVLVVSGNPQPATTGLSPNSATAGAAALPVTVNGSSFVNGAVVRWNGTDLATTFVNSGSLKVTIPVSDLANAGTANILVFNPLPGGGTSNAQTFTINAGGNSGGTGGGGGGGSLTAFVTANNPSGRSARNDFGGWVGTQFKVGSTAMNVTSVGRVCLPGNAGAHPVKFVNAATGQDVASGSASVMMAGCTPGQFVYAALPGVISLQAGASYYLASLEVAGADTWYDLGAMTTTADAAAISSVYSYNGVWYTPGGSNTSYVPPNFQYSIAAVSLIPVTVSTNVPGAAFSIDGTSYSSTQIMNWPAGSSHTIGLVSPQAGGTGVQYVWSSWSDGGAISHSIAPTGAASYTASLSAQYLLTTAVAPSATGSVTALPASSSGYYAAGTPVQLTATPATNATFLNWSGDLTGTINPQSITMSAPHTVTANFQPPAGPPPGTAFITGYATSGRVVRNDYGGWVGTSLTVGQSTLNVTSIGRLCLAGNAGTHTVKFVNASTHLDVTNGAAVVNMAGCTPGQFVYTALATPVALPAGSTYYLASLEVAGGDTWYDLGGISTTAAAMVNSSIYAYNGNWVAISSPNTSYGPLNFQY